MLQYGRFEQDLSYWQKMLSEPDRVKPVREQQALRFYLTSAADFVAFGKAMRDDLANTEFSDPADLGGPSDEE